ncbi:hypothetical protein EV363DRAFT_143801 [Boletus edulis]|nr:hypothetical protein EV363DRAFT_143801 [Boletus edulis]
MPNVDVDRYESAEIAEDIQPDRRAASQHVKIGVSKLRFLDRSAEAPRFYEPAIKCCTSHSKRCPSKTLKPVIPVHAADPCRSDPKVWTVQNGTQNYVLSEFGGSDAYTTPIVMFWSASICYLKPSDVLSSRCRIPTSTSVILSTPHGWEHQRDI